jgi:hypothetical protein
LRISKSDGTTRQFALAGHCVASFYAQILATLADIGIRVAWCGKFSCRTAQLP